MLPRCELISVVWIAVRWRKWDAFQQSVICGQCGNAACATAPATTRRTFSFATEMKKNSWKLPGSFEYIFLFQAKHFPRVILINFYEILWMPRWLSSYFVGRFGFSFFSEFLSSQLGGGGGGVWGGEERGGRGQGEISSTLSSCFVSNQDFIFLSSFNFFVSGRDSCDQLPSAASFRILSGFFEDSFRFLWELTVGGCPGILCNVPIIEMIQDSLGFFGILSRFFGIFSGIFGNFLGILGDCWGFLQDS